MTRFKEILLVTIFGASLTLFMYCNRDQDKKEIIKQATDSRGLTSVVYVQGNDTIALDYLTPMELDSLKR